MSSKIEDIKFDNELIQGASNAINICLNLKPEEKLVLITDEQTLEIAAALINEVKKTGAEYRVFVLEDCANRPLKKMPDIILHNLAKADVSIFAASTMTGELQARLKMTEVIKDKSIRHGHMVDISKDIMIQGMRADFNEIDRFSELLITKAREAKVIKVKSTEGSDITAAFSHDLKWIKTSGIISPAKWSNLPGGEIFTTPYDINGKFVVDGVVGDYLCKKYGSLSEYPLEIEIKNGRISKLDSSNTMLLDEFFKYVMAGENGSRVGEFAIGTNTAVKDLIGNILQDEKFPGVHIAFGYPYPDYTGADWTSSTHIDCVGRDTDIWFDDEMIMEKGKFLLHA